MPSIHVIWDPCDKVRVSTNDDTTKRIGATVALVQKDTFDETNLAGVVATLVELLLGIKVGPGRDRGGTDYETALDYIEEQLVRGAAYVVVPTDIARRIING